jgi:hypothetical protein
MKLDNGGNQSLMIKWCWVSMTDSLKSGFKQDEDNRSACSTRHGMIGFVEPGF